jgi:hypothetical protein
MVGFKFLTDFKFKIWLDLFFVKKIKKSPRHTAGGLERIFVPIDHKMCWVYIWLWPAGCQNIWNLGHFLSSPTF